MTPERLMQIRERCDKAVREHAKLIATLLAEVERLDGLLDKAEAKATRKRNRKVKP